MMSPAPSLHRLAAIVPQAMRQAGSDDRPAYIQMHDLSRPLHCDAIFEKPLAKAAAGQSECVLLSQDSYGNIAAPGFGFVGERDHATSGVAAFDDEIEDVRMDSFHLVTFADDVCIIHSRSRLKAVNAPRHEWPDSSPLPRSS